MATIELPKDAEGREIPLDTEVLYQVDGSECTVVKWEWEFYPHNTAPEWTVVLEHKGIREAFNPKFMYLTPRDSWEKLLEDLDRALSTPSPDTYASIACGYFDSANVNCAVCERKHGIRSETCTDDAWMDIASRIRKLRGEDDA